MTQRRTLESVVSGTLGTALLVAAFLVLLRAEVPPVAVVTWAAVALVAVFAFLSRYRSDHPGRGGARKGCSSRWGRRSPSTACSGRWGARPRRQPWSRSLRHLAAFALLDVGTLATTAVLGRWFPHRPSGTRR